MIQNVLPVHHNLVPLVFSTPLLLLLLLLLLNVNVNVNVNVNASSSSDPAAFNEDVLGLLAFKASIHDPLSKLASWNDDDDTPCLWPGVQCDPITHRVSHLLLDGFSLSGHNVGRSLLPLQFLRLLSLSHNNFSGSIFPINLTTTSSHHHFHFPHLHLLDLSFNCWILGSLVGLNTIALMDMRRAL